jgi:hypothetical protein
MNLSPEDPRLTWGGQVEFEDSGDGWRRPWRLPFRELAAVAVGHLADRARDAAGVRLDVVAEGELIVDLRGAPAAPADVTVDGVLVDRVRVHGVTSVRVTVERASRVMVWLPQFGHVDVGEVRMSRAPSPPPREPRWVTYGSSITQCRGADGPSQTWPALVARDRGWDATVFGFGGEAHLDPIAATTIAARPAELLSFCLGVNIHGHATFSERALLPAAVGFLETARAGREVPTLVVGPIASPANEHRRNEVGLTLARVREIVAETAAAVGANYLDGRTLLAESESRLLIDGVHPSGAGYRQIAQRIAPVLDELMSSGKYDGGHG